MRVISMNGEISLPFDYCIMMVEDNNILATTVDAPFHRLMATYSTHGEAMKAFNDMHNHYRLEYASYQFK